jgi:hypothetical protein
MKRYVTGTRPDGLSDVLLEDSYDEIPEIIPGQASIKDIWISYQTPADVTATDDPVTDTLIHEPPNGGAVFRVMKVEPGDNIEAGDGVDEMLAMHDQLSSDVVPTREYLESAKHPSMHRTNTLNYMVLVAGQLTALSENRDVVLHPGDVLVQLGGMHGWKNEGDETAVLVATLIDAKSS